MRQPELFDAPRETLETTLTRAADNGQLFYSAYQAAKILGVSEFKVYYRIEMYRLDALLIGEYRIPYTAIIRCVKDWDQIIHQWQSMLNFQRLTCFPGALGSKRERYSSMDGHENDLIDWYDLEQLPFPGLASVKAWEELIGLRKGRLAQESGWNPEQTISWPEMFDFMVEHEVLNLPCPYVHPTLLCHKKKVEAYPQPSLFKEE